MIAPASRKLGKYEIRQKLGRGGMADVYLANDTESDKLVALKLIEHAADVDTRDSIAAEMRGAVLQERLAAIDPRVVRVFDAGDIEGYFFVAMEYIDGQDLAELTRHGPLEKEFAVDVAIAVARTLENAHQLAATIEGKEVRGIVHGDIKPKNIRIDARGEVRVIDFGIAKALSQSRKLTRNEFGSVPYASPERLESGDVNAGSDLWSLAVMLYEMVTGMQPYHGETTERLEKMIRSRIEPPPAPDPCPEPLRRILRKSLSPEPAFRYQTAGEMAEDLTAFRNGGTVRAAVEDLDATRRTFRDRDETRRTSAGSRAFPTTSDDDPSATRQTRTPAESAAAAAAPSAKPKSTEHSDLYYHVRRGAAILLAAGVIWLVWAGISNYQLYARGKELEHDVASEQLTDPAKIWDRWFELSNGNSSSLFLRGPRDAVKQKFLAAADRTIDAYRTNDAQTIYESEWQRARTMLLHALSADPDDQTLHGKLRLVEGHLSRINGTVHHNSAEINDAILKFTEAQRILGKSPDPALGLAHVYLEALADIDKAAQAFQQAAAYGHPMGNRDKSQLADGYRKRADHTWWDTRNVRDLPQEKEQIQRAVEDYKKALDLYQQSVNYGKDTPVRIKQVQDSLDSADSRLQQIDNNANAVQIGGAPHGVPGAILNLIQALRGKKKSTGPGWAEH